MERRKGARSRRIFRRHKESNTGPEEKLAVDLLPDSVKEEPPPPSEPEPEPEPVDEDFDIFAGAGEYQGIPEGDDASDNESDGGEPHIPEPSLSVKGGWFGDAEHEPIPPPAVRASVAKSPVRTNSRRGRRGRRAPQSSGIIGAPFHPRFPRNARDSGEVGEAEGTEREEKEKEG